MKKLFEKDWESIVGNCDELVYLGGNEQSTHEYISELLGKETIDMNTYGKSSGKSGNFSTNYQLTGRELLTPNEVRLLDNKYALLFIRGERPVMDLKYDILKHPNVSLSADGDSKPYIFGEDKSSIATINMDFNNIKYVGNNESDEIAVLDDYDIVSSDDIDRYLRNIKKGEDSNE